MPQKALLKKLKVNEATISMFLGALVVVVIGILVFNYFRGVNQEKQATPAQEEETAIETGSEEKPALTELPKTYQVKAGDTLWKIAEEIYGSGYNWVDIAQANDLADPNALEVDQQLTLPSVEILRPYGAPISGDSYTVEKGDHLWGIAVRAYGDGYRWPEIAAANDLTNPNLIHPGNTLTIPR